MSGASNFEDEVSHPGPRSPLSVPDAGLPLMLSTVEPVEFVPCVSSKQTWSYQEQAQAVVSCSEPQWLCTLVEVGAASCSGSTALEISGIFAGSLAAKQVCLTLRELVEAALVVLDGLPDALEHIPAVLQAAQPHLKPNSAAQHPKLPGPAISCMLCSACTLERVLRKTPALTLQHQPVSH